MKACIVGAGVIGSGWVARFLLNGWDVAVFDLDDDTESKVKDVLNQARRSLPHLYDRSLPAEGTLTFCKNLEDALSKADWIQESVPERLAIKREIYKRIIPHIFDTTIIASSTSGFKVSDLQQGLDGKQTIIVAHPFNPVYLLPLVELVFAPRTGVALKARAAEILTSVGMSPLVVRQEIDAHIADRLLEALWREALWLVHDDIATTEEIDDAIRLGFGLRWAQMGLFETYRIAGGQGGMYRFMEQFGPALSWPWSKLTDTPPFTDALVRKISDQSDAQSGNSSIDDLERLRDSNLVGIIRSLKRSGSGAGAVINQHEKSLALPKSSEVLPITVSKRVPSSWIDENGHMNEVHYLELANSATIVFLDMIGADERYIASGYSYFAVETKLVYVKELMEDARVHIETQILSYEGKKLRLYHAVRGVGGVLHCGVDTLLLHIDMQARATCLPQKALGERLATYAERHRGLELPHLKHRDVKK